MQNPRERIRAECEVRGVHWAKSVLPTFPPNNEVLPYILEWINERESFAAQALADAQLQLAERSTTAAEASSEAARDSAKTSGTSARAALFSSVVSLFALVVAVAAYFKQT